MTRTSKIHKSTIDRSENKISNRQNGAGFCELNRRAIAYKRKGSRRNSLAHRPASTSTAQIAMAALRHCGSSEAQLSSARFSSAELSYRLRYIEGEGNFSKRGQGKREQSHIRTRICSHHFLHNRQTPTPSVCCSFTSHPDSALSLSFLSPFPAMTTSDLCTYIL